jgi:tetratricopeptide (TPR) repeat protein
MSFILASIAVPVCASAASADDCKSKDPQVAIAGCTAIIENTQSKPRDRARAHYFRSWAYIRINQLDNAKQDADTAISLDSSSSHNHLLLCKIFLQLGDAGEALASCDKAVDLDPGLEMAFELRGSAHESLGDLANAIEDYGIAIDLAPDSPRYLLDRANAYRATGDMAKALADYDHAIALEPANASAYVNRSTVHFSLKDYDKAINDCNKAIELSPDLAMAYLKRAESYAAKGEQSRAAADYKRAVELDERLARQVPGAGECRSVHLDAGKSTIAVPVTLSYRNLGPGRVILYSDPGSALSLDIEPKTDGGRDLFFGDSRYRYFIKLADPKNPAEIEICD